MLGTANVGPEVVIAPLETQALEAGALAHPTVARAPGVLEEAVGAPAAGCVTKPSQTNESTSGEAEGSRNLALGTGQAVQETAPALDGPQGGPNGMVALLFEEKRDEPV